MTTQARIKILAFAQAREVFGWDVHEIEIAPGATLAAVLTELQPDWRRQLPATRVAINYDFVPFDTVLSGGETVALIPPVSGG